MFVASPLVAALTASVSPFKRLLKAVLLTSAVGLLFLAMARPHLFYNWSEETRNGLDVLVAVDCSKSMLTEDVKPNRLGRAQLAIEDFADRLPDNRLGLIAFAGDAFLQCPLTLDHDAFESAVRELDADTIPRPGTNIASAIELAVDALRSQPNNRKFMILVTDGEDLEGQGITAARVAAQNGLKIFTIGVGTAEGDRIPERDYTGAIQYHHDQNGQEVVSRLDEDTLRQIAGITGGAYAPLGQRGEGLADIYDRYIASLPKQTNEGHREKIPIERFEWPLAAAILLLMWEFLVRDRALPPSSTSLPPVPGKASVRRKSRKAVATVPLILLTLSSSMLVAPSRAAESDAAERAYKSGQYDDAAQKYQAAVDKDPSRADLEFDSGDAAYRAGDFLEAEEAFRKALDTPDLNLQEQSYYNLGNAQYEHGQEMLKADSNKTIALWEKALHSYDSALKLKVTADAKHNYEFVKKKLDELKQQQQGKGQQNQPNQANSNQDQSGSSQNKTGDQQNQPSQGNPQNGGQNGSPQTQPQAGGDDKTGQSQANADQNKGGTLKTYSGQRAQDQQDPNIKSKQEAENLLDSLKDDEHHVTARTLNGDSETPPPPSGKDW